MVYVLVLFFQTTVNYCQSNFLKGAKELDFKGSDGSFENTGASLVRMRSPVQIRLAASFFLYNYLKLSVLLSKLLSKNSVL